MTIDREVLIGRWVHSHEEDTTGERVFRHDDHPFPPSRGRMAFELRADGSYQESAIGPSDRPEGVAGTWDLTGGDTIVITRNSTDEPERRLQVVSATRDRLVLRA